MRRKLLKKRFLPLWRLVIFVGINFFLQFLLLAINSDVFLKPFLFESSWENRFIFYFYSLFLSSSFALAIGVVGGILLSLPLKFLAYPLLFLSEASALFVILLDSILVRILGVHLDDPFIITALSNPAGMMRESNFNFQTFFTSVAVFIFFLVLQVFIWRISDKIFRKILIKKFSIIWYFLAFVSLLSVSSGLFFSRIELDRSFQSGLPFFSSIFGRSSETVGSWKADYSAVRGPFPRLTRKKNILFILVESFRADAVNPSLTPNIERFMRGENCIISRRHYSGSHATTWGTFSFLYGLEAYHFKFFHRDGIPSYPLKLLEKNGYQLVGAASSNLADWDHGDLFTRQFHIYREFFRGGSTWRNDLEMLRWLENWKARRQSKRPFFMFLFLNSTHHNYYYPPTFERFKPVMPEDYDHFLGSHALAKFRDRIFNRYKNSVLFIDFLFGEILKLFREELARGELAVALAGDHAEEFWDFGLLGHGKPRFINSRIQTPLLFCLPGIQRKRVPLSGHSDLMATLTDYLRPSPPLKLSQLFTGISLLRPYPSERFVTVTSYAFPYKRKEFALIDRENKFWFRLLEPYRAVLERVTGPDDRELDKSSVDSNRWRGYLEKFYSQMSRFLKISRSIFSVEPAVQYRVEAQLGEYLRFVGFNLEGEFTPGGTVKVSYLFEVLKPVPGEWNLFFHLDLLSPYRDFVNLDHPLVDGTYPLERWKRGQFVLDIHSFTIPKYFPRGGKVRLALGLWSVEKGRAPIKLSGGGYSVEKGKLILVVRDVK